MLPDKVAKEVCVYLVNKKNKHSACSNYLGALTLLSELEQVLLPAWQMYKHNIECSTTICNHITNNISTQLKMPVLALLSVA